MKEAAVRRHDGVGSDGHLAHVFRHAARELFGEHVEEITYRALRFAPAAYLRLVCPGGVLTDSQSRGDTGGPYAVCVACLVYIVYAAAPHESQRCLR